MRKYTSAARMPLWKWILCLLGGLLIFTVLQGLAMSIPDLGSWPLQCVVMLAASTLILFLYAVWVNLTERRPVLELPMRRMVPDTCKGMLFGILFFGLIAGVLALSKCYSVSGAQFDTAQITGFFLFLLVAVCEEVIFRGVLFRLIDDRWNTVAALFFSALLFGAAHFANPGATWWSSIAIAIEAGLLLGAAYKFSGNLWFPIGIHWTWNYVQGYVLGFAVSGNPVNEKILSPIVSGPDIVTGGTFGPEASAITVGVGLVLAVILLLRAPEDRRK
ncbi:MAG: CPBP family intramembrane metalloprotease [Bacteroidales bacterium]|nr:CPBP family intramembrane metalloprotease [Bacteroidales bacterium]